MKEDTGRLFSPVPENAAQAWSLIRRFIARWHGLSIRWNRDDFADVIADIERAAKATLPAALADWIRFVETMKARETWVLRDYPEVAYDAGLDAVIVLVEAEGGCGWAVKREQLGVDDPAVDSYTGDAWERRYSESLTSFLLRYMLDYHSMLDGTGGYDARIPDRAALIGALTADLGSPVELAGCTIFESPQLFAFITNDELCVHYDGPPAALPTSIRAAFAHQRSYYGPRLAQ